MGLASQESLLLMTGVGVIDEITIGATDFDATKDSGTSGNSGQHLGPVREFLVLSGGPGSLLYVDDITGATRTLTGVSVTGVPFGPVAVRTFKGTGAGSTAFTLRVRW